MMLFALDGDEGRSSPPPPSALSSAIRLMNSSREDTVRETAAGRAGGVVACCSWTPGVALAAPAPEACGLILLPRLAARFMMLFALDGDEGRSSPPPSFALSSAIRLMNSSREDTARETAAGRAAGGVNGDVMGVVAGSSWPTSAARSLSRKSCGDE